MVKVNSPTSEYESGEHYPIREVSRMTGVNSVTLRAWERRYGLIVPLRTEKGHRLYNNEHIERIKTITDWVNRGVPVSKVQSLLQQPPERLDVQASDEHEGEWKVSQEEFISAAISFNEPLLDKVYSSALKLYPGEVVTERLLKPAYDHLTREWSAQGTMSAVEGFLLSYLRNSIGSHIYQASQKNQGPVILCTNCPEDTNELNSLLLALSVCGNAGRARLLPPGIALYDIGVTAIRSKCDAVLLHSHKALQRETIERELPRLVRVLQRPVAISGQCTSIHKDDLRFINIDSLGDNPGCSARQLLGSCQI